MLAAAARRWAAAAGAGSHPGADNHLEEDSHPEADNHLEGDNHPEERSHLAEEGSSLAGAANWKRNHGRQARQRKTHSWNCC